jgi:NAD(P)-dependent dehydrogenase (short-subunit alcohol dehydrogenase family)
MSLAGRVALVTGGSRGIGAGIAAELAAAGADVAVNYHDNREAADEVAAAILGLGRRAVVYQADVTSLADCEAMVRRVLADFGKVDILVNNAGIGSIHVGRPLIVETKPEDIERLFAHHVMGSFYLCKLLVPQMRALPRGDVVMISSVAAQSFGANGGTYTIAKAGMEALAFTLAREERQHGIRVNVVAPGLIETDMTRTLMGSRGVDDLRTLDATSPFGFMAQPSDIGKTVAFLCSEGGRYITGERITVSGGRF